MPDASGNFRGSGWSRAREDGWEKAFRERAFIGPVQIEFGKRYVDDEGRVFRGWRVVEDEPPLQTFPKE